MTRIGLITVGQSPRSDVVPDMAAILGADADIVEAGALDGLDRGEIARLAPQGDDEIIVTRMRDGSPVFVGEDVKALDELPFAAVDTIARAVVRMNKMNEESQAPKDSTAPSGSSTD